MRAVEEMFIVVSSAFFLWRSSLPRISIRILMEVFQSPQMRSVEEMFIVVSPLFSRSFESSLLKLKPLRSSEGCWYEEQHLAVRYRMLELKLPLRVSVLVPQIDKSVKLYNHGEGPYKGLFLVESAC